MILLGLFSSQQFQRNSIQIKIKLKHNVIKHTFEKINLMLHYKKLFYANQMKIVDVTTVD